MLKRMLPTRNAGSRTALSAPLAEIHGKLHAGMHAGMYAKTHVSIPGELSLLSLSLLVYSAE